MIRKLVVSDGRSERELLLVGTIVVGRDPSCHINDMDPLLSRRHAEFVSSEQSVTIRDLKSRNGILVNGVKVPERALKPGDVVQLGHLHVRYVEEHPVLSREQEARAHATTTAGTVPTIAVARQNEVVPAGVVAAAAVRAAASAPTEKAPVSGVDEEVTVAPVAGAKSAPPPPARSAKPADDPDATVAPIARPKSSPPPSRAKPADDPDATRAPVAKAPPKPPLSDFDATGAAPMKGAGAQSAVVDLDATRVPSAETRAVAPSSEAPTVAVKTGTPTEARVVANSNLIVTEASPSCLQIIGVRPDTIVGGRLADALTRSLSFVTSGDGPSALSLTVTRASSGRAITITFKAGPATETLS